jgi:phage-related protein
VTISYGVDKPLVWLAGEIKTPPFAASARIEAGILLRRLQQGELLHLPHSRPMPNIGRRCHELRVSDEASAWRIVYRLDPDAVVIAAVFAKKTQLLPRQVLASCRRRLQLYDQTLTE